MRIATVVLVLLVLSGCAGGSTQTPTPTVNSGLPVDEPGAFASPPVDDGFLLEVQRNKAAMTPVQWSHYKKGLVGRELRDERGVIYSVTEYAGRYTLSVSVDADDSQWSANVNIPASEADGLAANRGQGVTFSGTVKEARNEGYSYLSIDLEPGAAYSLDHQDRLQPWSGHIGD